MYKHFHVLWSSSICITGYVRARQCIRHIHQFTRHILTFSVYRCNGSIIRCRRGEALPIGFFRIDSRGIYWCNFWCNFWQAKQIANISFSILFDCDFVPPLSTPSMRTLRVGLAAFPASRTALRRISLNSGRLAYIIHRMSALCLVAAFLEPAALPHHVRVATTTRHPVSVVIATGPLCSTHWKYIEPRT